MILVKVLVQYFPGRVCSLSYILGNITCIGSELLLRVGTIYAFMLQKRHISCMESRLDVR